MKNLTLFIGAAALLLASCSKTERAEGTLSEPIRMTPEYRGATFPANIAEPALILERDAADL